MVVGKSARQTLEQIDAPFPTYLACAVESAKSEKTLLYSQLLHFTGFQFQYQPATVRLVVIEGRGRSSRNADDPEVSTATAL
jgi:hypothetical protein